MAARCGNRFARRLHKAHAEIAAKYANQDAQSDVAKRMLAQDQPACADKAAKQNGEAQPPSGVKRKYLGESQQCADNAAGSSRVGAHFYPIVEHGAHYL